MNTTEIYVQMNHFHEHIILICALIGWFGVKINFTWRYNKVKKYTQVFVVIWHRIYKKKFVKTIDL